MRYNVEEIRKEAYLQGVHDMYKTLTNGINVGSLLYAKNGTQICGILKRAKEETSKWLT